MNGHVRISAKNLHQERNRVWRCRGVRAELIRSVIEMQETQHILASSRQRNSLS